VREQQHRPLAGDSAGDPLAIVSEIQLEDLPFAARLIERRAVPLYATEGPRGGHGNLLPVGRGAEERIVLLAVVEEEARHPQVEPCLLAPADRGHGGDEAFLALVLEQRVRKSAACSEDLPCAILRP